MPHILQSLRSSGGARMAVFVVLLAACFLLGGASRIDVLSLVVLQPLVVVLVAVMLLIPGEIHWQRVRAPLLILVLLAAVIIVQLIPLPPSIWTILPGRDPFVETAVVAGIEQPWRPISIAPDLTWSSLVALVVPATVLIGMATLSHRQVLQLLPIVIGGALVGALVGMMQITGGHDSPFYFYRVTNRGSAVGLFSNRNHHAFLLAATLPMLALWARGTARDNWRQLARWTAAGAGLLFLIPLILVTGSRGGLILSVLGLAFALVVLGVYATRLEQGRMRKVLWLGMAGVVVGGAAMAGVAVLASRDEALRRLLSNAIGDDARASYLPTLLQMARDFFPFGSGFGSFDPAFRLYEPFATLEANYFNHAHNDVLEMLITGGLAGALVVVIFLAWFAYNVVRLLLRGVGSERGGYALAGAGVGSILLIASMFDYPLRTPVLAAVLAIACVWLGMGASPGVRDGRLRED